MLIYKEKKKMKKMKKKKKKKKKRYLLIKDNKQLIDKYGLWA